MTRRKVTIRDGLRTVTRYEDDAKDTGRTHGGNRVRAEGRFICHQLPLAGTRDAPDYKTMGVKTTKSGAPYFTSRAQATEFGRRSMDHPKLPDMEYGG